MTSNFIAATINIFSGAFGALLRELVAEFTLTDNPANTSTSLLRSLCHVDDSVILGSWLQETDHKAIEDQVSIVKTEFKILFTGCMKKLLSENYALFILNSLVFHDPEVFFVLML